MAQFLSILLSIAKDLTDEDFENLKFLCEGTIPTRFLETIHAPRQLFTELIHCCALSDDNKDPLSSLLFHIGRHDLRNRLLGVEGAAISKAFNNLGGIPCKVPNFVGRKGQCATVIEKLTNGSCQIVSITGPPGFGKSAVAIQVGHQLISLRQATVYYISLRDITSLHSMVNSLLGALQIVASKEPLQQVRHYLRTITKDSVIILDNAEDMLLPEVKDEFCHFIKDVAETAAYVKILITSRQSITFFSVEMFELCLEALCPDHAKELLLTLEPSIAEADAEQLSYHCGGVPLVLRTTASLLGKAVDAKALIREFDRSPVTTLKSFSLNSLSHDHQLFHCLGICFDRLDQKQQDALITLAVFPTTFTVADTKFMLGDMSEYSLQMMLQVLVDNSMLQFDCLLKQYYVHGVIQSFCLDRTREEANLRRTYQSAKKSFNSHYLSMLRELYKLFLSKGCCCAVEKFLINRRNVRQALLDSILDPDLMETCIDRANEVSPFLAKVFRKAKFLSVFGRFTNICKEKGDKKRYSDCLTSEAYCILSHCACHLPCPSAVVKFNEAHRIQSELGDESSVVRAFCLSKLGRCFGQSKNLDEAIPLIKKAIAIREEYKDRIFVAVGYKDLAAAYAFNDAHLEANKFREDKALPVYVELLGDHPFTATLMDDMGVSYQALGDYTNAVKLIREALRMRKQSLGDHQETARSFHSLGRALAIQGHLNEALSALRSALTIQEQFLGAHQETVRTHRDIARTLLRLGREDEAKNEELLANDMSVDSGEPQPEKTERTNLYTKYL